MMWRRLAPGSKKAEPKVRRIRRTQPLHRVPAAVAARSTGASVSKHVVDHMGRVMGRLGVGRGPVDPSPPRIGRSSAEGWELLTHSLRLPRSWSEDPSPPPTSPSPAPLLPLPEHRLNLVLLSVASHDHLDLIPRPPPAQ